MIPLPNLPTDSFYKFLLIGGIATVIFVIASLYNTTEKLEEADNEAQKEIAAMEFVQTDLEENVALRGTIVKSMQRIVDNTEKSIRNGSDPGNFSEQADSLAKKYNEAVAIGDKYYTEWRKQTMLASLSVKKMKSILKRNPIGSTGNVISILGFGSLLLLLGAAGWLKAQNMQDKILKSQFDLANKEEQNCQSCGMLLKLDDNYLQDSKYCSHCHNGTNFNEPDLSLNEMKIKVTGQMRPKNFTEREIKKQTKLLSSLDRWKHVFRW